MRMDGMLARSRPGDRRAAGRGPAAQKPTEYFRRNVLVGVSFPTPRGGRVVQDRPRQGHVGQRLSARRGHAALQPGSAAPILLIVGRGRHAQDPGRQCRPGLRVRSRRARPAGRRIWADGRRADRALGSAPAGGPQHGVHVGLRRQHAGLIHRWPGRLRPPDQDYHQWAMSPITPTTMAMARSTGST